MIRKLTFTLTFALSNLWCVTSFSQKKPNILWIIADDWGQDASCYGTKAISTPNIDQLASEGIRYTHSYSNVPICSPSRSSFITGMHAATIRCLPHRPVTKLPLPDSVFTLMHYMREAGYYCTNSGKTDYNFKKKETWFDGNDWRKRAAGQPFFSQVQIYDPHRRFSADSDNPVNPDSVVIPPKYPDHPFIRKDWARYHEAVQTLDKKIGNVLAKLENDGLSENTIVFLFGDHGRPHQFDKQWLYEDGLKTPMIIRWPKKLKSDSVSQGIISLLDLAPTTLHLAGIDIPDHMQGQPFLGNASKKGKSHTLGFRERSGDAVDKIRSIRTMKFSLIHNLKPETPYINHSSYKRMFYPAVTIFHLLDKKNELTPFQKRFMNTKPEYELYDMITDPEQTQNLADEPSFKSVKDSLIQLLNQDLDLYDTYIDNPESESDVRRALSSSTSYYSNGMRSRGLTTSSTHEEMYEYWKTFLGFTDPSYTEFEGMKELGGNFSGTIKLIPDDDASSETFIKVTPKQIGEYLEYQSKVPKPGRYEIKFSYKAYTGRGMVQMYIDDQKVGKVVDQYGSTQFQHITLDTIDIDTTYIVIKLECVGKNVSSNDLSLTFDKIEYKEIDTVKVPPILVDSSYVEFEGMRLIKKTVSGKIDIIEDPMASNEHLLKTHTANQGEYLVFQTLTDTIGKHEVQMRHLKTRSSGQFELFINEQSLGIFDQFGEGFDTLKFPTNLTNRTPEIKLVYVNKNIKSSGSTLNLDAIWFNPVKDSIPQIDSSFLEFEGMRVTSSNISSMPRVIIDSTASQGMFLWVDMGFDDSIVFESQVDSLGLYQLTITAIQLPNGGRYKVSLDDSLVMNSFDLNSSVQSIITIELDSVRLNTKTPNITFRQSSEGTILTLDRIEWVKLEEIIAPRDTVIAPEKITDVTLEDSRQFRVFPNPVSSDRVRIIGNDKISSLRVFESISGKLVIDKPTPGSAGQLQVEGLNSGSYILQINNLEYHHLIVNRE